ncbi:MAG: DNA repair protein RadA [Chloroflexi bacterium]|nr:DNA repair protein RadA [Chloroflexota bacterium]
MPKPKSKTVFICEACGNESLKWEGRCSACGQWNTVVEARADNRRNGRRDAWLAAPSAQLQELSQVSTEGVPRLEVSSGEVNRALGGGIVPGSLILLAGDPGIGKSTLLLKLAADISASTGETLYVTGEESAAQVRLRADRLEVSGKSLFLLAATDLDEVLNALESRKPALAIVDSIQTLYDEAVPSGAGSVAQIRECARRLMGWAKANAIPIILSGHVTKGGEIAGPRVLEHMVDVVLYMEGDPISSWRLLKTVKNRFGSTNEVGVFEMSSNGLVEVGDPSRAFLAERREGAIGSVIAAVMEGSRPLLVEIQALTNPSVLPAPRRVATGIDYNRLLLVCAVLTRRAGLPLANQDVVVNVTGGLRVTEPAADLGLALAIASSVRNAPVGAEYAAFGEIGLSGEIRRVHHLDRRVNEISRLGLSRCLVPASPGEEPRAYGPLKTVPVSSLAEAVNACIAGRGRISSSSENFS